MWIYNTSKPWTTQMLGEATPSALKNNFWLPPNLATNSLLLAGSLIESVANEYKFFYVKCIIYCMLKVEKRNFFFEFSQISENFSNILIEKNLHIIRPMWLKPVLFKGQLFLGLVGCKLYVSIVLYSITQFHSTWQNIIQSVICICCIFTQVKFYVF